MPPNAALNWSFLATQNPPITPDNFTTTFRPWAITLQQDAIDSPSGRRIPAEWNMCGTHGVSFVQYKDLITTITGGDLGYNQPVTSDPLIGGPVTIDGDSGNGPGRLVDTNPSSPWSSQIYYGQLVFGSGNPSSAARAFTACTLACFTTHEPSTTVPLDEKKRFKSLFTGLCLYDSKNNSSESLS